MPREELPPFLLDGIQPLGLNSFSDTLLRALTCRYNSGLMFHKLWPRLRWGWRSLSASLRLWFEAFKEWARSRRPG